MLRRARVTPGGLVYHVLNRSVADLPLFRKKADFEAFERIMIEAHQHNCFQSGKTSCLPVSTLPRFDSQELGWQFVSGQQLARQAADVFVGSQLRDALIRLNPEIAAQPDRTVQGGGFA